jgi:hypothetical protein
MTNIYQLDVRLPVNRALAGVADLRSPAGDLLIAALPVLGKADNARAVAKANPQRDPLRVGGDTPTGAYAPARLIRQAGYTNTYGRYKLSLIGVRGDALTAMQNKRSHLLLHGGHKTKSGKLMPTFGCLRMTDSELAALAAVVKECLIQVLVTEVQPSFVDERASSSALLAALKKVITDFERKNA